MIKGDLRFADVTCVAGTMDEAPLLVSGRVATVADMRMSVVRDRGRGQAADAVVVVADGVALPEGGGTMRR